MQQYRNDFLQKDEFEALCTSIEEASKLLNAYCKGVINNNAIS